MPGQLAPQLAGPREPNMSLQQQIIGILRSRKFWALVASVAAIWTAYVAAPGSLTPAQAVQATVAALAAYAIGTGLEGAPSAPPSTTTKE